MTASQCGGRSQLGEAFVLHFDRIVELTGSLKMKMDERNSFHCHYCKAFFPKLRDLDYHVDTCHDSDDSEREDNGNNMIEDVYYSSQESDQEVTNVESVSDVDSSSDVNDDDDEDDDYVPDKKPKSRSIIKRKKKVLSKSRKPQLLKQVNSIHEIVKF